MSPIMAKAGSRDFVKRSDVILMVLGTPQQQSVRLTYTDTFGEEFVPRPFLFTQQISCWPD